MRLAQVVTLVRDQIRDRDRKRYADDVFIVRQINHHVYRLFCEQVEADASYHNLELELSDTDAIAVYDGQWAYVLPTWVHRVSDVRISSTSEEGLGAQLDWTRTPDTNRQAWFLDARRRLRVTNFADAPDLVVSVAKVPAKLTLGTLPDQSAYTASQLLLDVDSSATYEHESEPGAYRNAMVEVTTAGKAGQIRRVTGSTPNTNVSGSFHTLLDLESAWSSAPVTGNTYDMHVEQPEALIRVLVLLVANGIFQAEHDGNALGQIQGELAAELVRFNHHIAPRQDQSDQVWRDPDPYPYNGRKDPDKEYWPC